jgi:hypothetical protein
VANPAPRSWRLDRATVAERDQRSRIHGLPLIASKGTRRVIRRGPIPAACRDTITLDGIREWSRGQRRPSLPSSQWQVAPLQTSAVTPAHQRREEFSMAGLAIMTDARIRARRAGTSGRQGLR